jgi:hypothetical protein
MGGGNDEEQEHRRETGGAESQMIEQLWNVTFIMPTN